MIKYIIMKKFLKNINTFDKWFLQGLKEMDNLDCLCINLYDEEDENYYSCELAGAKRFYQDGDDWNFDEEKVYSRKNPYKLCSKTDVKDSTKLLLLFKRLLEYSCSNNKIIKMLKGKSLAFGFVDGRMYFFNLQSQTKGENSKEI